MASKWNASKGEFILDQIPIPPSENRLFMNVPTKGRFRGRIKTPEYRQYITNFEAWRLQNRLKLASIAHVIQGYVKLEIEFTMYFLQGAIYCKDGSIKRLDIQNRFKAICDCLARALGVNDSHFFKVSAEKCVSDKPSVRAKIKILETFTEVL